MIAQSARAEQDVHCGARCPADPPNAGAPRAYAAPSADAATFAGNGMAMRGIAAADGIDAWLVRLAHPLDDALQRLRRTIRATDPGTGEAIKGNAPSYHVEGRHFATVQLRRLGRLLLVLHLGACKRALPVAEGAIDDPERRLAWRGPNRATLAFADAGEVERAAVAVQTTVRQWMARARTGTCRGLAAAAAAARPASTCRTPARRAKRPSTWARNRRY